MKIETYVLACNEEKIMPYFLRHYTPFSEIILLESASLDHTAQMVSDAGGAVWHYDHPDEINDQLFLDMKNSCWRESEADWVIIVDADEYVYHPNLVQILERTEHTIFLPRLFNMFHERFPTTTGQIYEEVTGGREGGAKMNLFKPKEITRINYAIGCHNASPAGNINLGINSEIMTLHMRHLGSDYVIERNARASKRLSALNRSMGWGYHSDAPPEEVIKYMQNEMTGLIQVV